MQSSFIIISSGKNFSSILAGRLMNNKKLLRFQAQFVCVCVCLYLGGGQGESDTFITKSIIDSQERKATFMLVFCRLQKASHSTGRDAL